MTALIVARINVIEPEKMTAYNVAAGATVAEHGGTFALRGKHIETLLGHDTSQAVAIIQVQSVTAAQGWFSSEEYQALKGLRDDAAQMQFSLFEAV
ncbi:DUF1330 domain-containing protein [Shimia sp. NS0008-38b]|uniref:DUF1330 domain-containing protein n=1 Tax=Shimia sp. NS0008-38b TaxID=3127653 RepID=UPI0033422BCD